MDFLYICKSYITKKDKLEVFKIKPGEVGIAVQRTGIHGSL